MKKPESICIFGDSTAWGAWDMEKGGWVNRLWLYMAGKEEGDSSYANIYNCSVSGGTTEAILTRFESEAKIREADTLIFQSGGNDSYLKGKGGSNQISPDKFKQNIEEIIKRAKNITKNIMFIGLKNVDESKTMPVSWKDIYYVNAEIKKYNEIMENVCRENNLKYLDIFGLLNKEDFEDGLHPNVIGHEKIFIKVRDFLNENQWI
ncbi:MAG: GDSL-type esterase/lipase family protein [Candidatus Daviesbacteria bacterium]|nr:GDSL-type esterase/lipase family protein [Candidatus Daviesbacteria bacterium]MDZ4205598.1 GDSL-type esterase/lipase family protein [Patescibacteria group bacterium]